MTDKEPTRIQQMDKTETLRTLAGIAMGMDYDDAKERGEPIGRLDDPVQYVDLRHFDRMDEIEFIFDSGQYRIEIEDGHPKFVEVDDDG